MSTDRHHAVGTQAHRVARGAAEDTMNTRAVIQKRSSMHECRKRAEERTTKIPVGVLRWW